MNKSILAFGLTFILAISSFASVALANEEIMPKELIDENATLEILEERIGARGSIWWLGTDFIVMKATSINPDKMLVSSASDKYVLGSFFDDYETVVIESKFSEKARLGLCYLESWNDTYVAVVAHNDVLTDDVKRTSIDNQFSAKKRYFGFIRNFGSSVGSGTVYFMVR